MQGKKAVIIGGGRVAERKAVTLIEAGARVTVVSPEVSEKLAQLAGRKLIRYVPRRYRKKDIEKAFVVIAATDSPETNTRISKDAPGLVNVVDVPPLCNFIAPSVIERGPLTFAISTGGTSPAFAKTVRKELEKLYGPETGAYLKFISTVRKKALGVLEDPKKRESFLKSLASAENLRMLRSEGLQAVRKKVLDRFSSLAG